MTDLEKRFGWFLRGLPSVTDDELILCEARAILAEMESRQPAPEPKSHNWNDSGQYCLDCGDKDWMDDPVCRPPAPEPEQGERWESGYDDHRGQWVVRYKGEIILAAQLSNLLNAHGITPNSKPAQAINIHLKEIPAGVLTPEQVERGRELVRLCDETLPYGENVVLDDMRNYIQEICDE